MWCFTALDNEKINEEGEYLRSCSFQSMKGEEKTYQKKFIWKNVYNEKGQKF